jgi:DNA-binding CsgD family transcriptional regulator
MRTEATPPPPQALADEDWFAADPTPLVLLGPGAVVVGLNPAAGRLLQGGDWWRVADGRLELDGPEAHHALQLALAELVSGHRDRADIVFRGRDGGCRRLQLTAAGSGQGHRAFLSLRADPTLRPNVEPLALSFGLTTGEREVLRAVMDGLSVAEVAALLRIAENTVRTHLRALYRKLQARGLYDLIRQAVRLAG